MKNRSSDDGNNPEHIAGSLYVKANGKPTRAARKVANKAAALQVQAQEYAAAAGVPQTVAMLQALEQKSAALPALHSGDSDGSSRGGDSSRGEERAGKGQQEARKLAGIGKGTPGPGRPSEYTEAIGSELCAWIAGGGSLRAWCRTNARSMETVYRWMREDARFQARYAQAHEDRADTLADEMLEIADDSAVNASIEGVAAAKLRVETRRFIASKLRPQKWGDKQVIEHHGAVNIRIGIPAKRPADNVIDATPITPKLAE